MALTLNTRPTSKVVKDKISPSTFFTFILIYDFAGTKPKGNMSTSLFIEQKKTLIDKQIKQIVRHSHKYEIVLCVGLEANIIIKHIQSKYPSFNIRIIENQDFVNNNSCESLRLALNNITNNKIIVCNHESSITKAVISKFSDNTCYAVVCKNKNNNVAIGANIGTKPNIEYFSFGGTQEWKNIIALCDEESIINIKERLRSKSYKKKFVFELLNDFMEQNKKQIKAIEIK